MPWARGCCASHAPAIGLDPGFTLHDRGDSEDLMGLVRHGLGLSRTESRFPGKATCLAIYSRAVNAREPLGDVLTARFPWCLGWEAELKALFAGYVEAKQAGHVLDYDDLLLYWAEMLADPAAAAELGAGFDHVLVDEYQDTNRLQAEILAALKPDGRGVTVVGDDAQAIYGFRAAEVRNILDFPGRFEPPARVVTLERNYRSTAADPRGGERGDRRGGGAVRQGALDRAGGGGAAAARHRARRGRPGRLRLPRGAGGARGGGRARRRRRCSFRTAHHSGPLEVELMRRNIPFVKFGGLKFLEAAHVKDLLAVLRLAENPRDRMAGFRVLLLLPGVGPAAAEEMLAAIAGRRARRGRRSGRRRTGRRWRISCGSSARGGAGLAGGDRGGAALVRAAPRAPARGRGACAAAISRSSAGSPPAFPRGRRS